MATGIGECPIWLGQAPRSESDESGSPVATTPTAASVGPAAEQSSGRQADGQLVSGEHGRHQGEGK
jgi:hypothetical protein